MKNTKKVRYDKTAKLWLCVDFRPTWLRGYCAGAGEDKKRLLLNLRECFMEECADLTPCKLVDVRIGSDPTYSDWEVYIDQSSAAMTWDAPRGCQVRKLEAKLKEIVKRELQLP